MCPEGKEVALERDRELIDIACQLADLAERLIVLAEPQEAPADETRWLAGAQAELAELIRSVESG
jgi:hypothetical protein